MSVVPLQAAELGRHINKLVETYIEQIKRPLSNSAEQHVCDSVYVSLFSCLSLDEYVQARSMYCTQIHRHRCHKCEGVLKVPGAILTQGY